MRQLFLQIQNQVDVLSLRERGLLFLSGVAIIFLLWDFLLFTPQNDILEGLNLEMQNHQQKLNIRAQEATVLAQTVGANIDQVKMQQLAALQKESADLEQQLSELSMGLIPAGELLALLKSVLEQSNELKIERIEYLPPKRFELNTTGRTTSTRASGVFKHTVALTLEGSYFDLLEYLQRLEKLPWRLHWENLSYEVSAYPRGDIDLTVSTLSTSGVMFENR